MSVLGCQRGPATVMAELEEARHLAADARVQFSKAADASNRAVMADTDEASISNAQQAQQATKLVEHDIAVLVPLLKGLGVSTEIQVVERFQKQFSDYRSVDKNVLELAVENTNLKAQQLSFGPAREAADHIKSALAQVLPSLSAGEHCRAEGLAFGAVLSVRELQTLHAPHIASADDAAMTRMEQEISGLELKTANALNDLKGLVEPSSLSAAQAAFDQLKAVDGQIVALSRKNTNVRSLDLSLRVKPALSNACDATLLTLQTELANEGSKATR
ncbi:MAG: hypothetical protein ABW061_03710 [Polyangiaceae bacterium]